jgi:hypothetical protein
MDTEKIREIEAKIADLEGRWPSHSVPPGMWRELEELEDELERAREGDAGNGQGGEGHTGGGDPEGDGAEVGDGG